MEYKVIIKPSIARMLLQKGNAIVDIKPNKVEQGRTVFVFEDNDKFREDLTAITSRK